MYEPEHIRTWTEGNFRLELYDTFTTDGYGKSVLAYEFYHKNALIFKGADFSPSPIHAIDSDKCVGALLGFLSLKPGDTDREYFDSYTPEQIDFAISYGEELSMYSHELESPHCNREIESAYGNPEDDEYEWSDETNRGR